MDGLLGVLLFLTVVPVFIVTMSMPYLTRKTESFGVSIPEEVYDHLELKGMRKRYAKQTGIVSIIVVILYVILNLTFGNNQQDQGIWISISLIVYIVGSFLIFLSFHRKMKKKKAIENWTEGKRQKTLIHTGFREQKLTYSNGWFALSFVLTFAMIVVTYWMYDRIPEQIPMQYNYNGEVTNWAEKSYRSVMVMPIIQFYLILLFLFINTMIAKAKQQLNAENPEKSFQQIIIFRRRWSAYIIITGIGLTVLFSMIQLSFIVTINPILLTIVPLAFGMGVTVGAVVLSFTTGQGGSRVKTITGQKGGMIDQDDDHYWKLGQFYYNPKDPTLFLEKRFGIGWTINLARPVAWVLFLVIILLAVGIPLVLT